MSALGLVGTMDKDRNAPNLRPPSNRDPTRGGALRRLSSGERPRAGTCPSYGGYVATKSSGVAQTSQTQGRPSGISYRPNKRGVHMKKLFLGSVALVALGLVAPAAFAADRAVPAYAPPPPPVPVYTWTGCYVGASAGTSNGHSDGFSTTPGSTALGLGP